MAPLLLGFVAPRRRKATKLLPPTLSRIGGRASLWKDVPQDAVRPACRRCGGKLTLLAQLDTSYEHDFHRVLLVFFCGSDCHRFNAGWSVYRVLRKKTETTPNTPNQTIKPAPLVGLFSAATQNDTDPLAAYLNKCTDQLSQLSTNQSPQDDHPGEEHPCEDAYCVDAHCVDAHCVDALPGDTLPEDTLPEDTLPEDTLPEATEEEASGGSEAQNEAMYVGFDGPVLPCFELETEAADETCENILDDIAVRASRWLASSSAKTDEVDDAYQPGELISGDEVAVKMEKKLQLNPGQVMRYKIRGKPLWLCTPEATDENAEYILLKKQPAPCELCGSPRVFECQFLSTLTSLLASRERSSKVCEQMKWGTVAIYSCSNDCNLLASQTVDVAQEVLLVQTA